MRDSVAVVLQKNVLFSGTIKENLRWGNENATDEEIVNVCKLAQADSFVSTFPKGYDTYIEQGGTNVSGGQKQRVAIARAIVNNPKLLLADEPTGALDTKSGDQVMELFKELNDDGVTIVMITHEPDIARCAKRIMYIRDGELHGEKAGEQE